MVVLSERACMREIEINKTELFRAEVFDRKGLWKVNNKSLGMRGKIGSM